MEIFREHVCYMYKNNQKINQHEIGKINWKENWLFNYYFSKKINIMIWSNKLKFTKPTYKGNGGLWLNFPKVYQCSDGIRGESLI